MKKSPFVLVRIDKDLHDAAVAEKTQSKQSKTKIINAVLRRALNRTQPSK